MKIIHTSDLHLASALSAKLPGAKAAARRRELLANLQRLCSTAMELGASAIIIAGDLFDTAKITRKELDTTLATIERAENITFFYLPGNHERDVITSSGETIPKNLLIFGKDWSYFRMGNITVAGRSETSPDMFDTLNMLPEHKNIVVLHGEVRDRSDYDGVIGLKDSEGKNIDYLALGHYHTYSQTKIDARTVAVYSGTPEGRGFDEVGELGFSLINIATDGVTHRFIPFAARQLIIRNVDISGASRAHDVEMLIREATSDINSVNLVRANLVGKKELELRLDKKLLEDALGDLFYYFEIKDSSKLLTRAEDYRYDKSLKGEFIRLILSDGELTDEEKEKIINCALSALAGEAFDE